MTNRIVTKEDIENVLVHISNAAKAGLISSERANHYTAFILLSAFTGQRSLSTSSKLTVGQFRDALRADKPCIEVLSSQDKIKMQHYVPLHPQVIQAVEPLQPIEMMTNLSLHTTRLRLGLNDNRFRDRE